VILHVRDAAVIDRQNLSPLPGPSITAHPGKGDGDVVADLIDGVDP